MLHQVYKYLFPKNSKVVYIANAKEANEETLIDSLSGYSGGNVVAKPRATPLTTPSLDIDQTLLLFIEQIKIILVNEQRRHVFCHSCTSASMNAGSLSKIVSSTDVPQLADVITVLNMLIHVVKNRVLMMKYITFTNNESDNFIAFTDAVLSAVLRVLAESNKNINELVRVIENLSLFLCKLVPTSSFCNPVLNNRTVLLWYQMSSRLACVAQSLISYNDCRLLESLTSIIESIYACVAACKGYLHNKNSDVWYVALSYLWKANNMLLAMASTASSDVSNIINRSRYLFSQTVMSPTEMYGELCRFNNNSLVHHEHSLRTNMKVSTTFGYAIFGLLHLINAGDVHHQQQQQRSLVLPRQDEWIALLLETFVQTMKDFSNQQRYTTKSLLLSPFLVELLLILLSSGGFTEQKQYDWVYLELLGIFNGFIDVLRGLKASAAVVNSSRVSYPVNKSVERPPSVVTTQVNKVFVAGELVDGLVVTSNGSSRWFPGTVKAVNTDGTYHVLYNDGDEDVSKAGKDLRYPKKRGGSSTSSHKSPVIPTLVLPNSSVETQKGVVSDNSERLIPPITASVSPRLQTSNRSSTSIPITPATKTVDISRVLATTHLANVSIDEIVKVEYVDDVIHVHTARSGCSHGSNESGDNNVFEIPAVLVSSSTTLSTNKNVVIPRMQLNEIHLVSTAPHSASNQSLSSSLLRETAPITVNTRDSFNQMTSSRSSLRDDFTFRNMNSLPSTSRNSNNLNWSHSASELGLLVESSGSRVPGMTQLDSDTLLLLGATHDLICATLLQRSLVDAVGVDGIGNGTQVMFGIREYLEQAKNCHLLQSFQCISQYASLQSNGMLTLLKLLTDLAFKNCLSFHMENGIKISEGGFGSIYKVECTCDVYEQAHQVNSCAIHTSKHYAIKRIPRERSKYDNAMIYNVFNEVRILELLQVIPLGVCKLVDYGVNNSEYWLVMKCGDRDLLTWRQAVTKFSLLECLLLYTETLLIMGCVHQQGVVHFDIKAANFIFTSHADTRVSERSQAILHSHKEGKPAGILQVIDFGEALLTSTASKLDRSRGTLAVLSPEMLALNTANGDVVIPSYSSDIWSLGCLLVEVILGHFLYQDVPWPEMYVTLCMLNQEQANTQYRPISDGILNELKALIPAEYVGFIENILVKILQQKPAARPTIPGILSDVSQLITRLDLDTPVTTTLIPAAASSASLPASLAVKETLVMLHNKAVTITETVVRFDTFFLCVTSTNPLEKKKNIQGFYPLHEGIGGTPSDSDNTCDHINNEVFNVIFNASLARFNQILLEKQIWKKNKYHVIHIGSEWVSSKQGSSEEVTQHSIYLSLDPLQLRQNYQRILQEVKGNKNVIIILYPSSKPDSFSALAVTLVVALVEELSGTTESYHHGVRSTVPVLYDSHNKMIGTYLNMA